MQIQPSHDEKTVVIATGLGLFCLIMAIGALALWAADALLELSSSTTTPLFWALVIIGGTALVVYLVRARRR